MDTPEMVLSTLHGHDGWVWDGDVTATNEALNAEFWFDGGTPRLRFDGFIAGHLDLTPAEHDDPAAILREIEIEVERWQESRANEGDDSWTR